MFQEDPANGTILNIPEKASEFATKLLLDEQGTFSPEPVHEFSGTALVIVFDLDTRPLQIPVVIQEFQASQNLLRTAGNEGADMSGAQETVAMHVTDDLAIAFGKLKRCGNGRAPESG